MFSNKKVTVLAMLGMFISAVGLYAADQQYILTFTERTTIVLMRVTRTDTGIRVDGAPVIYDFGGRVVGTTAVDPITDGAGNLTQINVYVSFVGANGLPAVSMLTFNPQLQTPFDRSVTEIPLTKLKLGQYQPMQIFQFGPTKRLLAAGPVNTAQANDYFAYALNPTGIPTGPKKVLFNNPTGDRIFGAAALRQGGLVGQLKVPASASRGNSPAQSLHEIIINRIIGLTVRRLFGRDEEEYFWYCVDFGIPYVPPTDHPQSPSATNAFMASRTFRNPGTPTSQSQIVIQGIDTTAGAFVGSPIPLSNFVKAPNVSAEIFQSVALADDSRLVAYTVNGPCQRQIVKLQGLKQDGTKDKAPKIVFGCDKVTTGEVTYGLSIASLPTAATPSN